MPVKYLPLNNHCKAVSHGTPSFQVFHEKSCSSLHLGFQSCMLGPIGHIPLCLFHTVPPFTSLSFILDLFYYSIFQFPNPLFSGSAANLLIKLFFTWFFLIDCSSLVKSFILYFLEHINHNYFKVHLLDNIWIYFYCPFFLSFSKSIFFLGMSGNSWVNTRCISWKKWSDNLWLWKMQSSFRKNILFLSR